ncbi:MAG: metallophosphoesterase [Chloroflexota bacterium]
MKILAVSDEMIDRLYHPAVKSNYPDVRMIVGCGDLPYNYLEFLVTVFNVPLYYVPGNHDPEFLRSENSRAEGGLNLDGRVIKDKGIVIAGLGGSIRYRPVGPNQYTQSEMYMRVIKLLPRILLKTRGKKLDLLITHSPPFGIHDDTDPTHVGLRALNFLIKAARPRYMLHGHTIFYKNNVGSHISIFEQTQIININPFRILDINPDKIEIKH